MSSKSSLRQGKNSKLDTFESRFHFQKYLSHSSVDLCNWLPLNINDNIVNTNATTPLVIKTFMENNSC